MSRFARAIAPGKYDQKPDLIPFRRGVIRRVARPRTASSTAATRPRISGAADAAGGGWLGAGAVATPGARRWWTRVRVQAVAVAGRRARCCGWRRQPDGGWGMATNLTLERTRGARFLHRPRAGRTGRGRARRERRHGGVREIHRGWENPPTCPSSRVRPRTRWDRCHSAPNNRPGSARWWRRCPPANARALPAVGLRPLPHPAITVGGVQFMDNPCSAEPVRGLLQGGGTRIESFFDGLVPECSSRLTSQVRRSPDHSTTTAGRPNVWVGYSEDGARRVRTRRTVYAFDAAAACTCGRDPQESHDGSGSLLMTGCDPSSRTR